MSWETLTPEQRERIEIGDLAMENLRGTESVERWREVGDAFLELQAAALRAAGTNQPVGVRYNGEYAKLLDHAPHLRVKDRGKNVGGIDKSTKAHAMWLASNWHEIERWRTTLATNVRMSMVHPTTIRRRHDAAHRAPIEGDKPPSSRIAMQDQIIKLTEQLDAAHKLKTSGVITAGWSVEDLIDHILDQHNAAFMRKLAQLATKPQRPWNDKTRSSAVASARRRLAVLGCRRCPSYRKSTASASTTALGFRLVNRQQHCC
jgi:hypothetical protein